MCPAELVAAALKVASAQGTSLHVVAIAAIQALLHRYTGEEESVISVASHLVRTRFSDDPTFEQVVRRVRDGLPGGLPGAPSSHADVHVVLGCQDPTPGLLHVVNGEPASQVAWLLTISVGGEEIAVSLTPQAELVHPHTKRRVLTHLETLLHAAVAQPTSRVSTMPLLTERERGEILHDWNDTGVCHPALRVLPEHDVAGLDSAPGCLHTLVFDQAARTPDAVALACDGNRLTYRDLCDRARVVAQRLRDLGVGPDVPVGLCLERSPDLLVAILGILEAGGAYVPLDPAHPRPRLELVARDAGCEVVVTQRALVPLIGGAGPAQLLMDENVAASGSRPSTVSDAPTGSNLAYVMYTSGSTGQPKGVCVTHASVVNLLWSMSRTIGMAPRTTMLAATTYAFDISVAEFFLPLMNGGTVALLPDAAARDPEQVLRALGDIRPAVVQATPTMWNALCGLGWRGDAAMTCIAGGEPLPAPLARSLAARCRRLWNFYGPTETTIWSTAATVDASDAFVSIGRPLANTQVYVVDRRDQVVPVGVAGELLIGGAGVARGYHGRAELTAERFVENPFRPGERVYRTGDLARWHPDGQLELLGRTDTQVKIRGHRIELGEIEALLSTHPSVTACAVTAITDGAGQVQLAGYVVTNARTSTDRFELQRYLRDRLPDYMVPAVFVRLPALPTTANGKTDRRALPAPDARQDFDTSAFVAPRTPDERTIAQVFAEVLGIPRVSVDADFFDIGGHSLLATRVAIRLRRLFGCELRVRDVFEHATVARLAAHLAGRHIDGPGGHDAALPPGVPLSFAQERFWFLTQLEPESAVYNMEQLVRLRGTLDVEALRLAFQAVIDRHAVLRTIYVVVGDEPQQVVLPAISLPLPVVDLETIPVADREARARQLAAEQAGQIFDLARDVPIRAGLFKLASDEHLLQLVVHHIAGDGWSLGLLWDEVSAVYAARLAGGSAQLPELREQYTDFAVWQRNAVRDAVARRQMDYWRSHLEGFAPVPLPADSPSSRPSGRGAALNVFFSQELSARIRALCGRQRVTPFMVLLAAFQALHARLTGHEDVAVGLPVATRQRPELEYVIGPLLNTVVIRTRLAGVSRFSELLKDVRECVLGALDHQDLPFEQVVAELGAARNPSRSPFFQVLFNTLATEGVQIPRLPGIDASAEDSSREGAKFDLTLYGTVSSIQATYDVAVFSAERIAEVMQQYVMLLEQVTLDPECQLADCSLVTNVAKALLPDPHDELPAPPFERSAPEVVLDRARVHGDAEAIRWAGGSCTYATLARMAAAVAGSLVDSGLSPGHVVALEGPPSVDLYASCLGIMLAGGVVLPLEPSLPRRRKQSMVRQAGAERVLAPGLPDHGRWWREDAPELVELPIHPEWDTASDPSRWATLPRLDAESPAYIFFTSGSTGEPKGIVGHHRGLAHFVEWQRNTFLVGPGDRVAQLTPLSFDVVLRDIFLPLTSGATLCVPDEAGAARNPRILEWCRHEGITVLHVVPSVARQWLATRPDRLDGWSPKVVFSAGEPLTASLARRWREVFPGLRLVNLYGPTETCMVKAWYEVPPEPDEGSQPAGRPLPSTQLLVLGPSGQPCGIGEPGEIAIRTPCGTKGYLDITAAAERDRFRPNPFRDDPADIVYWTGDIGRYRRDGVLELLGRKDHQVKVRGVRVEPREIEAAIETHPAVGAASVSSRTDAGGETTLVAHVVARDVAVEALRAHLSLRLPAAMLPDRFVFVDRMPLTANGKVDRAALPEPSQERPRLAAPFVAPGTATERAIAEIFSNVLGVSQVGVHDDFFALGGHSLLATRALVRIQGTLGHALPLRAFFEAPSVAGLAALVEEGTPVAPPPASAPRIDHDELPPVTFAQQRLWLVDQFTPGQTTYVLPYSLEIAGELDVEALKQSLDGLVARHAALRTTIVAVDGTPRQQVHPPPRGLLSTFDLRHLPASKREEEVRRLAAGIVGRPFNLSADMPLRARLMRVADDRHVLVLVLHHIATDGWSMGIFWRELGALYSAQRAGREHALPPLPAKYADVARWEREHLHSEALEQRLGYWRHALADLPTLELPTDRPRPPHPVHKGGRHEFSLPADLTTALETLAREERATLFHTLFAGFQVLLARYTGQADLAVGVAVANRARQEYEGIVGFFANTLVLRARVDGTVSFRRTLGQVKHTSLEAFDHQDLPFERLVEDLRPERAVDRNPLVQVVFAFQNAPGAALSFEGLQVTQTLLERPSARFDLELHLWPAGENSLCAHIAYSADLFDAGTIERLAANFEALLTSIVHNPDAAVGDLALLSHPEECLLGSWNDTARPFPGDQPVHRLFEAQVEHTPEALALRWRDEDLTYRELNRRANQLARRLRACGVSRDVVVAVALPRSPALLVSLLAILKAGGAYLPLDASEPAERWQLMLEDADARLLLTSSAQAAASAAAGTRVLRLDLEATALVAEDDRNLDTAAGTDDLAYVMYTSGSTGRPKGVEIPHRGIVRLVWADVVPMGPGDAVLQLAPVSFDASTFEIWAPLLRGARCVLYPEADLDLGVLERVVAQERITRLWLTSSLFNTVIDHRPEALAGLEWLLVGGEALSVPHVSRALARHPSLRVMNGYGPTEATTFTCVHPIERPLAPDAPPIPIGRPIANTTVYVLDERRQQVPIGAVGELYVGGPGLARGYRHRDDLTRERFVQSPFGGDPGAVLYKTGDRVRYRSDGTLEFLGRADRQVKIRGFRLEPEEIERVLMRCPGVGSCAVLVREDTPGDKRLVAYVVPAGPVSLEATTLSRYAREHLPHYMVPSAFVMTRDLPLTANGKIDRRALPAPDYGARTTAPQVDRPLTDTEAALTKMWCDVLGLASVGIRDSFFELGGHSLLAVRLFARIENHFGVRLPLARLLSHPTIGELASVLDNAASSPSWSPLVPIRASGERKPLFLVHGIGGEVLSFNPLALQLPSDLPVYGIQGAAPGTDVDLPVEIEAVCARYVDVVLSVDSEGPYFIGGYSSGGVYALELAHQLRARGKEVKRLFVIDGGLPSTGDAPTARHTPWSLLRQLAFWLVDDALSTPPRTWGRRIASNARLAGARLRRRFDPNTSDPDIRDRLGMWNFPDHYARYVSERYEAFRRYRPRPYPGRIVLLRSRTGRLFRPPAAAVNQAWLDLASDGLDVVELPGSHTTVLHDTHVSHLARAIEARL